MNQLTYGNPADELVLALTHGPIPGGIQNWEVLESGYDDESAWARVMVDGKVFLMKVEEAE
jgi:hypothetical protein